MRTAGLTMNDVWAYRILHERGVETHRYERLSAEIGVFVESAELKHRSQDENYRPYLHITGELRWLAPVEALPDGISRVIYSPGRGETVDAFYEFDDQQLVALASKGYFRSAFTVPEQRITGIEWELPATVDILVLVPSDAPADVPVIFTRVHAIADLEIDLASCGYDLTDYFDDHPADDTTRTATVTSEPNPRTRSGLLSSLFPDEDLARAGHAEPQAPIIAATTTGTGAHAMDTQLSRIEADIDAQRERYRTQRESTHGTAENFYHRYVAQPLRTADEPVTTAPSNVDLERELPHAQPGAHADTLASEEDPREHTHRTADLDLGTSDGYDLGS